MSYNTTPNAKTIAAMREVDKMITPLSLSPLEITELLCWGGTMLVRLSEYDFTEVRARAGVWRAKRKDGFSRLAKWPGIIKLCPYCKIGDRIPVNTEFQAEVTDIHFGNSIWFIIIKRSINNGNSHTEE